MSRSPLLVILAAVAAAAATVASSRPALAGAITVTTTTDELNADGDCSLREAVRAANLNVAVDACPAGENGQTDTITLPAGTYTLTLPGNENDALGGDLDLRDNTAAEDLVIAGAGAATTIVQACAVQQQTADCPVGQGVVDRVLNLIDANVAISGLTVRHGRAVPLNSQRRGSGIYTQRISGSTQPALTLTDVVVTKNGVASDGFNGAIGGGIAADDTTLTLNRVTVSENLIDSGSGGGIHARTFAGGVSILVITDSSVIANANGGPIGSTGPNGGNGGGILVTQGGVATITDTTIAGNAGSNGGGIASLSGASVTLTNCTVSGNRAFSSSGGGAGGILQASTGVMNVRSTTVTANRLAATTTGGSGGITARGPFALRNSIVAGNVHDQTHPAFASPDCDETQSSLYLSSEGNNVVGVGTRCPGLIDGTNGDQVGTLAAPVDAGLEPLADNGGGTLTHAILADSPAIDAGNPAAPGSGGTACPATDQRGETRPSGIACDAGAFERGGVAVLGVASVYPAAGGNAGTVLARVDGSGFETGAVVRLERDGFPAIVGATEDVRGSRVTAVFDLAGAAPGPWSVTVENPDSSTAMLADAFTVEAGGGADIWAELVLPRWFVTGRTQTIYLRFGNRGNVDARAVPLWISFPDELEFHVPFEVSPPPAQPGQIATDWTRIAIDAPIPLPANRDSFPMLLPLVPAGSTGTVRLRLTSPLTADPARLPFRITADVGEPYYAPDLPDAVVAGYVERAKAYASVVHGTSSFPSDATIAQYVRTQLAAVVTEGTAHQAVDPGGDPPIYSQTQLVIDSGQFIAGESATAFSSQALGRWLARLADTVSVASAEARLIDPDCPPGDAYCEREIPTCEEDPTRCEKLPLIECDKLTRVDDTYVFVPCNPKQDEERPLRNSFDPNDKVGPAGNRGYIDGVAPLPYTVFFENLATATGAAFEVTVTDQLDVAKFDLDTFSLGPITFGRRLVAVPPGLQSFSTRVDLRPDLDILVGIDAALDRNTGIVTWKLTTLDPATGQFPENPEDGFLPPNVTSPEGEGAVLFTVSLKPGFADGTTVCNDARIVFDFNAPIDTPQYCNTIGEPEDCENCIDDNGNALVDRADPDCAPRANGGGAGAGAAGKAVDKCAKAIRKAGTKLAADHLKQLGVCQKAVADCVQLKPGDAACLAKARQKCARVRAGLPAAGAKLTTAITKACSEPAVGVANLLAAEGLGFDGQAEACGARGLGAVATVGDVADCVRLQQTCAAERVLGSAVPRAGELLALGGFDLATELACLPSGADGAGGAVAAARAKAIRKCDVAIQKATSKLLAGRRKAGDACGAAVFTCVQTKPGDASCVSKAGAKCTKSLATLTALETDFAATVGEACGATSVEPADLLATEGVGAAALTERCAALGVPGLATAADFAACVERQVACRADQLLESATPRLAELLGLGGVAVP